MKYKTIAEAKRDGWQVWNCSLPTTYVYFINIKNRQVKREDELIEDKPE